LSDENKVERQGDENEADRRQGADRVSGGTGQESIPSEEELRARLEEELRRITVREILVQTVVSLVNLGGQRLGLAEGTGELRDLGQVRTAIEGVRALLPLLEADDAEQVRPVRDALAQLQLAYAREVGSGPGEEPGEAQSEAGESPGEGPRARGTGGLWVPPGSAT
jgi:hypothetical protein